MESRSLEFPEGLLRVFQVNMRELEVAERYRKVSWVEEEAFA